MSEAIKAIKKEIYSTDIELKTILNIKSTVWVAHVEEMSRLENGERKIDNVLIRKSDEGMPNMIDFLGPDIDLGFRISKKSTKNQIVVSAEFFYLYCLICDKNDSLLCEKYYGLLQSNNFKLLACEEFKGIWHKRKYPIILFRENWNKETVYEYDEQQKYPDDFFIDNSDTTKGYVKRVFEELGKAKKIENYIKIIRESNRVVESPVVRLEYPVDVHIVMIIFSRDGKVLLFKRSQEHSNPGKFDFGCTNIKEDKKINELLIAYYLQVFETSVKLRVCEQEKTKTPIPIATYEYKKDQKIINGIIFAGRIDETSEELIINQNAFEEYEEIRFEERDNLDEYESAMFEGSIENIGTAWEVVEHNLS